MKQSAYQIMKHLKDKGFDSFIVGGSVRDMLMEQPMSDIDIATKATPNEAVDILSKKGLRVIPTGIEHGTVTVLHNEHKFEVTTFRKDVSCDGRNAVVEFALDLEEDLARRDFTINAIAYCPFTDRFIDPFDGKKDIESRSIRTVGDAVKRYREDYLRMFRAFRFSSTLDFCVYDPDVIEEVNKDKWEDVLSVERIKQEFDKCFSKAIFPSKMISGLWLTKILEKCFPELAKSVEFQQNRHHKYSLWWHILHTLNAVPKEYPLLRWVALFHDLGKIPAREFNGEDYTFYNHERYSEEIAYNIMKRFKFSNDEVRYVLNLVKHHMFQYKPEMKDSAIRRLVASLGQEYINDLLIIKYADRKGKGVEVSAMDIENSRVRIRLDKILKDGGVFKIKDLNIDGNDIMRIKNIRPSIEVGKYLKFLYEQVLENPELNTRERLEMLLNNT